MNPLGLIRTESYKKGMLLSVFFNFIAKGILFLLTILIAKFFGRDIKTDIYFFIYGTMVLLSGFINTIDTVVLVPESMRIREKQGPGAAAGFLNYFFRIYIILGLLFVAVIYFFAVPIFGFFSRFSEPDIIQFKNYFLLGSAYFFFMVLTNYINNILTSLKFFTIPMIISGINSCIVIAGIVLLQQRFDVLSILIAGVAAYSINLFILLWLMKKIANWKFFGNSSAIKKIVWGNISFAGLGQFATLAGSFLPLYLLSGFGQGIISAMNYGKNIADIPNTLVTSQLTSVSGVQFNEQAARQDFPGMNESFVNTGKLLLFILVPLGCFLFVFADAVVRLFYLRGSFTEGDVVSSAKFLQLLAVTIFSIGINSLVSRIFIAVQAVKQAFLYQLVLNALLMVAIWLFTKYYGAYGYPYAIILMNSINFIGMFFICKKIAPQINYATLLKYTALLLLINVAISAGMHFAQPMLNAGIFGNCIIPFLVYLFILLLLNKIFHLNSDLAKAIQYVQKRIF